MKSFLRFLIVMWPDSAFLIIAAFSLVPVILSCFTPYSTAAWVLCILNLSAFILIVLCSVFKTFKGCFRD